jgi:hypothetical protein
MTLRYLHLAPSPLCEAIDLLNLGQPMGGALSRSEQLRRGRDSNPRYGYPYT